MINFHMFTVNGWRGGAVVWCGHGGDDDEIVDGDSADGNGGVATAVFFQCCKISEAKTKTD